MTSIDSYSSNPQIFELSNSNNTLVRIMDWGATILDVIVTLPSSGQQRNLVLGTLPDNYSNQLIYFGATIGRFANRIQNGQFKIDGTSYQITIPSWSKHALHGGINGFDKKRFTLVNKTKDSITLALVSPDGDQGFPGEVTLTVCYTLTDNNELQINYQATSTALTPINITNHSYWNLDGYTDEPEKCTIRNHKLKINTDTYLPLDNEGIPLGTFAKVDNSIMDFRNAKPLTEVTKVPKELKTTKGLDHPYVFRNKANECKISVESCDGLVTLQMYTDYPAAHVYTANYLNEAPSRKPHRKYNDFGAIALEPEYYPNAINTQAFAKDCPVCGPKQDFKKFITFKIITK